MKNRERDHPQARFELATLRLTAEVIKNLSALSGVAYMHFGAILASLTAPNPAPTLVMGENIGFAANSKLESRTHTGKPLPLACYS